MAPSFMAFVCAMALFPLVVSAKGNLVISPPIPKEGDDFSFECGGYGDLSYFLLHQEGRALTPGIYSELQIEVFDNATVYFERISIEHQGTHLCIRNGDGGDYHGYPTELRVRPLPSENLWEDVYKAKFITGFIAALVIASMFTIGCLVQKYRWRPKEADTEPMFANSAYVNQAMTNDDAESGCSTKM